jgi:hypothetical protein
MHSIPTAPRAVPPGGEASSIHRLARTLRHLLDPSRDRPALWLHPSFAADVALERRRLHQVVRARDLAVPPGLYGTFADGARELARDARLVAVAVRCLEIERSAALPSWDDLVRRGLPATPSLLDTAIWFG